MPRPRRKRLRLEDSSVYRQAGRVFLVTICTRRQRPVFLDLPFGEACVDRLGEIARCRGSSVYAYCLMPDHVHLVIGVHERCELSAFVQSWKSACTAIWRMAGEGRSFWQRSFHDRAQRRHEHLRATCRYVLANPVRAGLVATWREYPLSGSMEWKL